MRLHDPEPWWAGNSFVRAAWLGSLWRSPEFGLEYLLIDVFSSCQSCLKLWESGFSNPSDQPASWGTKTCFRVVVAHKFTLWSHKKRQRKKKKKAILLRERMNEGVFVSHFICCVVTTVPQIWKQGTGRINWETSVYYHCLPWIGQHSPAFWHTEYCQAFFLIFKFNVYLYLKFSF